MTTPGHRPPVDSPASDDADRIHAFLDAYAPLHDRYVDGVIAFKHLNRPLPTEELVRRVDARIEEFNSEAGRIALPVRLRRVHAPFDEKRRAASSFRVKREPDHPLHLNAAMGKLIQLLRAVRKPIHGQMFKDLVATTLPDPAIEREAKGLGSRYEKTLRHRRWAIANSSCQPTR